MGKDAEFLDAARTGNIQVVEKVLNAKTRRSGPLASLRRGPGANVQDSSGYTALHHAALNGHRSVVSLLLRHEASVNVQDDKGSTALHLAAWAGHDHVIKILLTQGPSVPHINHQNKGGDTALHFAAQYGHIETTRLLLKNGADPTLPNLKAETPLDLSAQFGRFAIAELLMRESSDLLRPFSVDAATAAVFPHTPLHLASRNGHLGVVRLLLNHGHHVNVRTSQGSPLHEAAICGKVDVVRALMEAGADSEVKNDLGYTVLDTISAINTPVTQEISGLIKSHHAKLIDIDDDDDGESQVVRAPPHFSFSSTLSSGGFDSSTCGGGDSIDEGRSHRGGRSCSPTSSVATLPSFEFQMPPGLSIEQSEDAYKRPPSPSPSIPIGSRRLSSSTSSSPAPPLPSHLPSLGAGLQRPSSAPSSNPFISFPKQQQHSSVALLRSESLRSGRSSPSSYHSYSSSPPPSLPPSECGGVYENVLVPARLHGMTPTPPLQQPQPHPQQEVEAARGTTAAEATGSEDGENLSTTRTVERRSNSKGSSDRKDYTGGYGSSSGGGRVSSASGRESRLSDRDCCGGGRLSDRESGRFSDLEGSGGGSRALSSELYEVPPPPSRVSVGGGGAASLSLSDRSSVSTRSSSAHEVMLLLDDEGTYEVPPPPRPYPPLSSLRGTSSRDHSDGETSSTKPHPPPKPPRRSICPPSPTPVTTEGGGSSSAPDDGSSGVNRPYEMIYFATTGERKNDNESSDGTKSYSRGMGNNLRPSELRYKTLGHPVRGGGRKYGGTCSSDSDSDSGKPHRNSSSVYSNKGYTTMSFKPVKSRRTSKSQNLYENTIHRYENIHHQQNLVVGGGKKHYHHHSHPPPPPKPGLPSQHSLKQQQYQIYAGKGGVANTTASTTGTSNSSSANGPTATVTGTSGSSGNMESRRSLWYGGGGGGGSSPSPSSSSSSRYRHAPPPRAISAHGDRILAIRRSDGSSDESDEGGGVGGGGGRRPKSLDFVLDDDLRKRCSKDAETETDPEDSQNVELRSTGVGGTPPEGALPPEGVGVGVGVARVDSSCSLSSVSVASLSDRSASTDNIEEVRGDVPFAGLYRGSRMSGEWPSSATESPIMALERPRSLTTPASAFKAFERGCRSSFPSTKNSKSVSSGSISSSNIVNNINNNNNNSINNNNNISSSGAKDHHHHHHYQQHGPHSERDKGGGGGGVNNKVLSPLEEDEEWARIGDIMKSFGGGLTRESVFMAELEYEFQQRLGMSLSPSQQKTSFLSKKSEEDEGGEGGGGGGGSGAGPGGDDANESEENVPREVGTWLKNQDLGQYEATLLAHGYDDVNFLNGLLDAAEMEEMGISDPSHRERLSQGLSSLPSAGPESHGTMSRSYDTLEEWLAAIHLPQYAKVFRKHGFGEMERVRKIWEVELEVVLEVSLQGHKKRMLASLGDRPIEPELPASLAPQELSLELSKLNTDISELKEKLFQELPSSTCRERRPPETATNTIRRGTTKRRAAPPPPKKAPRAQPTIDRSEEDCNGMKGGRRSGPLEDLALRDPSQLVVGVPQTLLTEWKHHPTKLVTASVEYLAQYLGSTHVKELKGTESTMKSIDKLRKSTAEGAKVPNILLAVSYLGVRFIDAATHHVVCEHEIRNIHCACQDADDLCHFAYITKDSETLGHYCHVFRVQSRDLATEIIMTLGEAFEVAYQLTLREQQQRLQSCSSSSSLLANQSDEQKLAQGHSRSKSEHLRNVKGSAAVNASHVRSFSSASNQLMNPFHHHHQRGSTAPNTSLENLLSDSGNFSDSNAESNALLRRESSSPSVDSSTSGSAAAGAASGGAVHHYQHLSSQHHHHPQQQQQQPSLHHKQESDAS